MPPVTREQLEEAVMKALAFVMEANLDPLTGESCGQIAEAIRAARPQEMPRDKRLRLANCFVLFFNFVS